MGRRVSHFLLSVRDFGWFRGCGVVLLCPVAAAVAEPSPAPDAVAAPWQGVLAPLVAGASESASIRRWAGTTGWKEFDGNPVVKLGEKGEWDSGALGSMTVLKVGTVYHLYYEAWSDRGGGAVDYSTLQIGHAVSPDGIHWAKDPANPVLPKGSGDDWDKDGTWDPFVIHEDGRFKMWFGGGQDSHCDWGFAVSSDGSRFEKKGRISRLGNVEDIHVVHDLARARYFLYCWDRRREPAGLIRAESRNETDFDFDRAVPVTNN